MVETPYPFTGLTNVDYKQPFGYQNDFRTSYDYGHRLIYGNDISAAPCSKNGTRTLHEGNPDRLKTTSETKDAFACKFAIPNKKYTSPKIDFLKSYDETSLKFVTKPANEHLTTYRKSFAQEKPHPSFVAPAYKDLCMEHPIKKATYTINPNTRNYTKYLDMIASSYNLDYVMYSEDQIAPMASQNTITLWNWNEYIKSDITKKVYPAFIATFPETKPIVPSRTVLKTHEIPSLVKYVPNKGLLAESREKYCQPNETIKVDPNLRRLENVVQQTRLTEPTTESGMIGSGKRSQRYI